MSKTLFFTLTLLSLSFTFSSCTITSLRAFFESDTVGSDPIKNLPGTPTGDEMKYNSGENKLEIIYWNGGKALEVSSKAPAGVPDFDAGWNSFISAEGPLEKRVRYTWKGQLKSSGNGKSLFMDFSVGTTSIRQLMRFIIDADGTLSYSPNSVQKISLGKLTFNQEHTVRITFSKKTETFGLVVFQTGEAIKSGALPITETNVPFPASPRFNMSLKFHSSGATGNSPVFYRMDEVLISSK